MTMKKCDRCGKYYEANQLQGRKFRRVVTNIYVTCSDGTYDEVFDLCDDCLDAFYEFMKMAEVKDDV